MADATLRKLVLQKAALQREFGADFGDPDKTERIGQKLDRLSVRVDALDGKQDTQETTIDGLERRVESLESSQSAQNSRLDAIEAFLRTLGF